MPLIPFLLSMLLFATTIMVASIALSYTKRQDCTIVAALLTIAVFGYIFLYLNVILTDALEQFRIYYLTK